MLSGIFSKNEKGFTLIEIILISAIVLLISVSIIVPFAGGKKTWQSADKDSETIQNAVIGMEKVVREIKNSPGLTYFDEAEDGTVIRFKVLRNDPPVIEYAMVKLGSGEDSDVLLYGECSTDSSNEEDYNLGQGLAYLSKPVTELKFDCFNSAGEAAGTPDDVKLVRIKITTSDGGVTISLTASAYLVTNTVANFDDTPDDPAEPGLDEYSWNEGNEKTKGTPPPGSLGDGVLGWGLTDYVVFGDEGVEISNNCTINGNVGTRTGSNTTPSKPYIGQNSVEVNGYLVVKGTLLGENAGVVNKKSVLAACAPTTSFAYPCSSSFKNSAKTYGYFWTLKDISMENTSRINKTVHIPHGRSVPDDHIFGDPKKLNFDFDEADPSTFPTFMRDPMDFADADTRAAKWGSSVFPMMPPADTTPVSSGALGNISLKKKTQDLPVGQYGNVDITNSSNIVIHPNSKFLDFVVANSSYVTFAATGDYYFNRLEIGNSAKLIFNFDGPDGTGPIRIFIKDEMVLINSSSFDYLYGGDPIDGANLLYVEAYNGFSCSNSVQWRGFVYSPNGNVEFSNSSNLAGAVYSKKKVIIENHTQVTYVPPLYMDIAKLLDDKFYPQITP